MTPTTIDAAAAQLVDALRRGTPGERLSPSCRPANIAEAFQVQRRVSELRALAGERIAGWKCTVPSAEKTIAAPIFDLKIYSSSPCPVPAQGTHGAIEPEIAFVIGRDLPPREAPYSDAEVRSAIGRTVLVLELMGCRYSDPAAATFPEILADGSNHFGLYCGPAVEGGFERVPTSFPLRIDSPAGNHFRGEGRHPNGDPTLPLAWLANFLRSESGFHEGLKAGEIVTTGSYAGGVVEVPLDASVTFTYGSLGTFTVTFTAA